MFEKIIRKKLDKFLARLNFLIVGQYGDVTKEVKEDDIMASGYYLVAKKTN